MEFSVGILFFAIIDICVSLIFYNSLIPVLIFAAAFPLFIKVYKTLLRERRSNRMRKQFRDGISALTSALRAGVAAENAMDQAIEQMRGIYGADAELVREFQIIKSKLSMNSTIEAAFSDLAVRSGLDEIRELSEVFAIAKRSGGSLPDILQHTVHIIDSKLRVFEEIETMMTGKRLEQRIMCLMPIGIILYMNITSPEFMEPMYSGLSGRVIMSILLLVYIFSIYLGERIMKQS